MSNKTFNRHLTAVTNGKISKSNIIGMRKGFNAWWRNSHGYSASMTAPQWTDGDAIALQRAIHRCQPVATGALHDDGLCKLRDRRNASLFNASQRHVISRLECFRLIDWRDTARGKFQPVWEAIAENGESFRFISLSWQFIAYSNDDTLKPIIIVE